MDPGDPIFEENIQAKVSLDLSSKDFKIVQFEKEESME